MQGKLKTSRRTFILAASLLAVIVGGCGLLTKLQSKYQGPVVYQFWGREWLRENCRYLGPIRAVSLDEPVKREVRRLTIDMAGNAYLITYLSSGLADADVYRCPPELLDPDSTP